MRLFLALALLLISAAAEAACPAIPYTFANGTVADANQVNTNFASVLTCASAAVTGPSTSVVGHLAAFNANSGKVITDFGSAGAAAVLATGPNLTLFNNSSVPRTDGLINIGTINLVPAGIPHALTIITGGTGDNTTAIGSGGIFLSVGDSASVALAPTTRGNLYGYSCQLLPLAARNNPNADDAACLVMINNSTNASEATAAIYSGHNPLFTAGAPEFTDVIQIDSNGSTGQRWAGTYGIGIDYHTSTLTTSLMKGPNNKTLVSACNAAACAGTINALGTDGSDNTVLATKVLINTGANSNMLLRASSDGTNYNIVSLNGGTAGTSMIGIQGGQTADTNLYYRVPTGGTHKFQVNAVDVVNFDTSGVITPGGYKSSDGSAGLTVTCSVTPTAMTFKNGLLTSRTGGTCP